MKVFRLTSGVAIKLPQSIVQALSIRPGEYFDLVISDQNTIVAKRLKIVRDGEFGERPDETLPTIKHD